MQAFAPISSRRTGALVGSFKVLFGLLLLVLAPLAHTSRAQDPFPLSAISPPVIYPEGSKEGALFCRVTLRTAELQSVTSTNQIAIFINQQKVPDVIWTDPPSEPRPHRVYATHKPGADQIDLWLPWSPLQWDSVDYRGNVRIQLVLNNRMSEQISVTASGVDGRWWPAAIAIFASIVILLLPVGLIQLCGSQYSVADKRYNVLAALFLDKETDTYSLSKFQFYAWTAAAVVGYFVLMLSQSLVQAKFVFPDIPDGLPGIIFISAATAAAAQGVTSARGPKGSGSVYPCFSDFVTTGGLIVPERFQFFVWTNVGVITFLFLVIFSDPESINNLPEVPNGFLQIMGISSFGYLGGKLARKPGPIIDEITAVLASLTLSIRGRNLSGRATIKIGDASVSPDLLSIRGDQPEGNTPGTELFKALTVYIPTPDALWHRSGKNYVTVINPDGQEAQWYYTIASKPNLLEVTAKVDGNTLTIAAQGSDLSKDAILIIDGVTLRTEHKALVHQVVSGPDQTGTTEFHGSLRFVIPQPETAWLKLGIHRVKLRNPDGSESAEKAFTILSRPVVKGIAAALEQQGASTLSVDQLLNLPSVVTELKQPNRAFDHWIAAQLSAATNTLLGNYQAQAPDPALHQALVQDLNKIIAGPSIFEQQRFAGIVLRPETQTLLSQNPQGSARDRLNRLLIEDAYPLDILRNQQFLVLTIEGSQLSGNASLTIDDAPVPTNSLKVRDTAEPLTHDGLELFGRVIFVIDAPDEAWMASGDHKVTVTNPDGAKGDAVFKL